LSNASVGHVRRRGRASGLSRGVVGRPRRMGRVDEARHDDRLRYAIGRSHRVAAQAKTTCDRPPGIASKTRQRRRSATRRRTGCREFGENANEHRTEPGRLGEPSPTRRRSAATGRLIARTDVAALTDARIRERRRRTAAIARRAQKPANERKPAARRTAHAYRSSPATRLSDRPARACSASRRRQANVKPRTRRTRSKPFILRLIVGRQTTKGWSRQPESRQPTRPPYCGCTADVALDANASVRRRDRLPSIATTRSQDEMPVSAPGDCTDKPGTQTVKQLNSRDATKRAPRLTHPADHEHHRFQRRDCLELTGNARLSR